MMATQFSAGTGFRVGRCVAIASVGVFRAAMGVRATRGRRRSRASAFAADRRLTFRTARAGQAEQQRHARPRCVAPVPSSHAADYTAGTGPAINFEPIRPPIAREVLPSPSTTRCTGADAHASERWPSCESWPEPRRHLSVSLTNRCSNRAITSRLGCSGNGAAAREDTKAGAKDRSRPRCRTAAGGTLWRSLPSLRRPRAQHPARAAARHHGEPQ